MLPANEWFSMYNTLRDKGYSEMQIAEFNRLSMLEMRLIRSHKLKLSVKSADITSPIVEGGEYNEKD